MLPTYVRLFDIEDLEGFVAATIERSGLRRQLSESEREELIAEGICIAHELADSFEPHRAGYATSGRFSGFAAQYLPRRLGDAWHARSPGHRRLTAADGTRTWSYEPAPISLNTEDAPDPPGDLGAEIRHHMPVLEEALLRMAPWERFTARKMANLHLDGYGWDEIADLLDISRTELGKTRDRLGEALREAEADDRIAA